MSVILNLFQPHRIRAQTNAQNCDCMYVCAFNSDSDERHGQTLKGNSPLNSKGQESYAVLVGSKFERVYGHPIISDVKTGVLNQLSNAKHRL